MLTRNENFMRMTRAVADTLRKHEAIWNSLPRFATNASMVLDTIKLIDALQVSSDILTTGATADKAEAAEAAIHMGNQLSRRAIVYADDQHLYELRNQLKINRHELLQGHDAEVLHKLRDVQAQLTALLPQLPDYGVTQLNLTSLTQAIDHYEALMNRPRDIIVERKSYNETIAEYVKVLRKLLYKLDHLVNNFEGTDFEHEYHNARIVIDLGTRHRKPSTKTTPPTDDAKTL